MFKWQLTLDSHGSQTNTVKSPNFVTAHYFATAAENFCEALIGF
jgi:hypothetical protein